jgi:hypothetical protein
MASVDDQAGTNGPAAGFFWTGFLGLYLILLSTVTVYLAVKLWPDCPDAVCPPLDLELLRWTIQLGTIGLEERLFWTAVLFGAIGSYIHVAASFSDYVGNRRLTRSWIWWFVLRTPIGIALALVFYAVIRAGFLTMNGGGDGSAAVNPFGIAAISALSGMFSKQATDKLNEVFSTLFKTSGDERRSDKLAPAVVAKIDQITTSWDTARTVVSMAIKGSGFSTQAKVKVDATEFTPSSSTATDIAVTLTGFAATVGQAVTVVVKNPAEAGGDSQPYALTIN